MQKCPATLRVMATKLLDVSNDTLITHRGLLVTRLREFADQWEADLKERITVHPHPRGLHPHPKKFRGQPEQHTMFPHTDSHE